MSKHTENQASGQENPAIADYVLTIKADSGYESTTEGRCTADQYAAAMGALHNKAEQPHVELICTNDEVDALRDMLEDARQDLSLIRMALCVEYEPHQTLTERMLAAAIQTPAALSVLAERQRQINAKGWTPEHDDSYLDGALSMAAGTYIDWVHGEYAEGTVPINWPWDARCFKPTDTRRNLVKAAALILAEIERLDRAEMRKNGGAA